MGQAIVDALAWFFGLLQGLLGWVLDAFLYIIKGILWLFVDGILTFLQGIIGAIDYSQVVLNWAGAWSGVPQQAIYLLNAVGFPQFVTVIAAAYALRLVMNLVPSIAGFSFDKL